MRAGKLDRSITIQRYSEEINEYGTPEFTWTDVATVRAQIVQASTDEYIRAFGASDETVIVFRVRWLDGVTNADRVVYESVDFNIKETKEIGRRKGLELRCVASGGDQ
jgi:SPP1 family predicted phage head-tail adaptor